MRTTVAQHLEKLLGDPFVKLVAHVESFVPHFNHRHTVLTLLLALILFALIGFAIRFLIELLKQTFARPTKDRAEALYKRRKFEKAIPLFLRLGNFGRVAQCYVQLERYDEAAKSFEKAKIYDMAAKYYMQEGQYQQAAIVYQMSGRKVDAAEAFELANEYRAAGDLYRSSRYLKKAEKMYALIEKPELIADMYLRELSLELKRNEVKGKNEDETKMLLERQQLLIVELAKKSGHFATEANQFENAAKAYLAGGHLNEAAISFEKANHLLEAAEVFMKAGDQLSAARCFEKNGDIENAINIYRVLEQHDAVASGLEKLGRAAEAAEYRATVELKRGQKLDAAKQYVEAGKFSEAANLMFEVGSYEEAANLYTKASKYSEAGEALKHAKKLEEAATAFIKAQRYSSAAECYLDLGQKEKHLEILIEGGNLIQAALYLEKERPEQAIDVLQKIETDSPDYRYACFLLGRIFIDKNMLSLANEKLTHASKDQTLNRNNLDLFYEFARLKSKQQELEESLSLFDQILSIDYHYRDVLDLRNLASKQFDQVAQEQQEQRFGPITVSSSDLPKGALGDDEKSIKESRVINQRYVIEGELGRGGMGIVYKANDRALQRPVALKFLPPSLTPMKSDIDKFLNEARLAARLNHSNIVTIYDIECDSESQSYFIVMEFVDGINLKEIIESSHNLPIGVIKLIGRQICDALGYAHSKHIVHRDIKSANLLWTNDKTVKVTDFGLAKLVEENIQGATKSQGSPVYMSPEQVLGKNIDHRTDFYSFGISLYEITTGAVPFDRGDIGYHHINTAIKQPKELRGDIPEYLNSIIMKCLEKDANARFQSATEIKTALESGDQ